MVQIFIGIALTLLTAAFVLQIIGTLKEINLMTAITKPFIAPMILVSFILMIKDFLPDSRFLMINGILSISLCFLGNISFMLKKTAFKITGSIFFIASMIFAFCITQPSLLLYPIKVFPTVLYFLFAISVILSLFVFFIKNKKAIPSSLYFIFQAFLTVYVYSCMLTLIGEKKLYAILLLTGTLFLGGAAFFQTKKETEENPPLYSFLSITCSTVYLILFAVSCILMQAL